MSRGILMAYIEEQRKMNALRRERILRRALSAPMNLPEKEFVAHFRLKKDCFKQLVEELRPLMHSQRRKTAVPLELKVLAALYFYAQGSYQKNVASSYLLNMSQPTLSKCLHEVTDALNNQQILRAHIKFPTSTDERQRIMEKFMDKFGFPGIVGCIDGTHVALIRPRDHEETYYNRKNYHSLNVLIICDADLNILHVNAAFGGASHDSFVWNQSPVKDLMERLAANGERCWLLGDSGYAQRPWMMTPILGAAAESPEEYYTNLHCRVRNTVERCIGVLKARWRCLLAHRVLHYDPVTSGKIVNACIVLHNIANAYSIPVPELSEAPVHEDVADEDVADEDVEDNTNNVHVPDLRTRAASDPSSSTNGSSVSKSSILPPLYARLCPLARCLDEAICRIKQLSQKLDIGEIHKRNNGEFQKLKYFVYNFEVDM